MKQCSVEKCKNEVNEAWIDIFEDNSKGRDSAHGRFPFCDEHFDKIMPYLQEKEKEMQKVEGESVHFAYAPLSYVNEALNQ